MLGAVTNHPLAPSGDDGDVEVEVTKAGSEPVAPATGEVCPDTLPATSTAVSANVWIEAGAKPLTRLEVPDTDLRGAPST